MNDSQDSEVKVPINFYRNGIRPELCVIGNVTLSTYYSLGSHTTTKAEENLAYMAMYVQQVYYIQGSPSIFHRYLSIITFSNGEITDSHRKGHRLAEGHTVSQCEQSIY